MATDSLDMRTMEARLQRLEHENRGLKKGGDSGAHPDRNGAGGTEKSDNRSGEVRPQERFGEVSRQAARVGRRRTDFNFLRQRRNCSVRSAPGLSKIGERGLGVDSLYRGKKQAGIRLLVARNGAPSLKRIDEQGRARTVPGSTALRTAQTGVVEKRAPTSLLLFGENGKVLFDAMSNE